MQVSGEAQGSEDSIKSFLKELNSGPSAAHVTKVEKEEITTKVCILQSLLFPLRIKTGALAISFRKGQALFHLSNPLVPRFHTD